MIVVLTSSSAPAIRALAVQHDLVLGDVECDPRRDAVDGALERLVGERLHLATAVAHHVVVVMAVGPRGLVTGGSLADLDAADETQPDELVEDPVDRGAGDGAAALAQRVLDVVGAERAGLAIEEVDDRGAGAAAAEPSVGETLIGVFGPGGHRTFDGSGENDSRQASRRRVGAA